MDTPRCPRWKPPDLLEFIHERLTKRLKENVKFTHIRMNPIFYADLYDQLRSRMPLAPRRELKALARFLALSVLVDSSEADFSFEIPYTFDLT